MTMRVQVTGDVIDLADELFDDFVGAARQALQDASAVLLKESQRLIAQRGRDAPAPPGETPATRTGNLLRMTKTIPARVRGRTATSGVRYAPHAHLLEYGHVNADGTRTLPRPFIGPAAAAAEEEITRILNRVIP